MLNEQELGHTRVNGPVARIKQSLVQGSNTVSAISALFTLGINFRGIGNGSSITHAQFYGKDFEPNKTLTMNIAIAMHTIWIATE